MKPYKYSKLYRKLVATQARLGRMLLGDIPSDLKANIENAQKETQKAIKEYQKLEKEHK